MFSAIQKDGKLFSLFPRHSRDKLKEKKKHEEFICPECLDKVILKLGTRRMEHFAHQKNSQCSESYESESDYHLNGKLQLYEWLENKQLKPLLEPYYSSIRQRPDIAFMYQDQQYALEFQCSPIPHELMNKRTKRYHQMHAPVIWILGGKNINRKGERKVSLTNFDYLFASKSPSGSWYLPAYCPSSKIFILLNNLSPVSTRKAFADFSIIPLSKFQLQNLFNCPEKSPFTCQEWKKEIQQQKWNLQFRGGLQNDLLKDLYESGLNLSLLPPLIGIPVCDAPMIESPPLVWQAYLFLDHLYNREVGTIITVNDIFQKYVIHHEKGRIKERVLPLTANYSRLLPLIQYFQKLVHLGLLEALNTYTFRLKERVYVPEHPVMQQKLEEQFYQRFGDVLCQLNRD